MTTYKELKYDNTECYVECANRDGHGNVISSTYATFQTVDVGLASKQNKLPETSTAGLVLKSTSTAGTMEWGTSSDSHWTVTDKVL